MTARDGVAERVAEILRPYRGLISGTPALLSLLYDADMLPEQTVTVHGAITVAAVCEAYRAGIKDALATTSANTGPEPTTTARALSTRSTAPARPCLNGSMKCLPPMRLTASAHGFDALTARDIGERRERERRRGGADLCFQAR